MLAVGPSLRDMVVLTKSYLVHQTQLKFAYRHISYNGDFDKFHSEMTTKIAFTDPFNWV